MGDRTGKGVDKDEEEGEKEEDIVASGVVFIVLLVVWNYLARMTQRRKSDDEVMADPLYG